MLSYFLSSKFVSFGSTENNLFDRVLEMLSSGSWFN